MPSKPLQRCLSRAVGAVCLMLSATTPVHAQVATLIEEVLVTAQKRSESLTDVPISIGVMVRRSHRQNRGAPVARGRGVRAEPEHLQRPMTAPRRYASAALAPTPVTSASTRAWGCMWTACTWASPWPRTSIFSTLSASRWCAARRAHSSVAIRWPAPSVW